jgi:hypothetical protein
MGWAYRDDSDSFDTLVGGSGSHPDPLQLVLETGTNDFLAYTTFGNRSRATNAWPGNDQWVFWVFVYVENTDTGKLYLNGVHFETEVFTSTYGASPGTFQIGANSGSENPFVGKVGHVAVVEGELTAQQIADLYTASGN